MSSNCMLSFEGVCIVGLFHSNSLYIGGSIVAASLDHCVVDPPFVVAEYDKCILCVQNKVNCKQ
jgi:hypothetical protein